MNPIIEFISPEHIMSKLLLPQAVAFFSDYFMTWLCGGVGCGKTHTGSLYALYRALTNPETTGIITANTYKQLYSATLVPFTAILRELGLKYVTGKKPPPSWGLEPKFEDYEGVMSLRNGAFILLRSLDNWEPIKGTQLGWAWSDEVSDSAMEAILVIIERLRCPKSKRLEYKLTGTPDGENWLWDMMENSLTSEENEAQKMFYRVMMSARDNPFLPKEYIPRMLLAFDKYQAAQQIDGRVVRVQSGRVYYNWDSRIHKFERFPYDPNKPLRLCMDFNVGDAPMSATVAQVHNDWRLGIKIVQFLDEIIIPRGNTRLIVLEYIRRYGMHQAGTLIHGDSTGHYRGATTGDSDYDIVLDYLRTHRVPGVELRTPPGNPNESHRTNAVNCAMLNSYNQVRLFTAPRCVELIKDWEQLKKDKYGKIDKSNKERSHTSDASGYLIVDEMPVSNITHNDILLNLHMR